jgi:hypothetical protein
MIVLFTTCAGTAAHASGAWTAFIRPYRYNDLLVEGDTIWCATQEAGLLRFSRSSSSFESIVREPGGLASNRLSALVRDQSRRLWVGTLGAGASVFTPASRSWRVINAFDGLPSDSVLVFEAVGDTVWIGTSSGLAFWDGDEVAGALPDGANPSPFASNWITGIEVVADTLWVATLDGIYRTRISVLLSGGSGWARVDAGFARPPARAMAANAAELFALDSLTVRRWNRATTSWDNVTGPIGFVQGLFDDRDTVLAASGRGIFRWNGASWDTVTTTLVSLGDPRRNFSRDFVAGIDEAGRVAAASQTGLHVQPARDDRGPWPSSIPSGPPGNDVRSLAFDGSRLYVNTEDEGIGRFDGTSWTYWFPPPTLVIESDTTFRRPQFVKALLVGRDGRKWFGCWDFALDVLDDSGTRDVFTHLWPRTYPVTAPDTVRYHTWAWSSAVDSSGGHWFGMEAASDIYTAIGLEYYDANGDYVANYQSGTSRLRGSQVHGLTVDHRGRIWVGYKGQGIEYFNGPPIGIGGPLPTRVTGTDNLIVRGLIASGEVVWALTSGELRRYALTGALEGSYDLPRNSSPSDFAVRPLDVAADGTLWAGTAAGILVVRPDGSTVEYSAANSPLTDDDVRAVQVERATGVVWIGTAVGVNRFDPSYVPPPVALPPLAIEVYPNPARITAIGIGVRLCEPPCDPSSASAAGYRGEIYDLAGRVMHRFLTRTLDQPIWDGKGPDGSPVKPGIYFVRTEVGGRSAVTRLVLLR